MAYVGTPTARGSLRDTLASVIQGEAGGQGTVGMQAVGAVIANRAATNFSGYGGDLQSQVLAPNQFQGQSGTPSGTAYSVADALIAGNNPDPTGGALYYANPGASSASWARNLNSSNALKIGDHYFTDNTNGVPFTGSGAGSTIADGSPNNSSGLAAGSGGTGGDYVTANPDGTSSTGDLTQYPVAGVNAPSGQSSTSSQGGGMTADAGQGSPVTQGLQQGTIDAITKWVNSIESATGGAFSGALKSAQTAVGTLFGGVENWFIRAGLIVLGIILIAVALVVILWDHGGQQVAQQAVKVAAI
jgi:N-acetylmuramoyl-L-alanine amidase